MRINKTLVMWSLWQPTPIFENINTQTRTQSRTAINTKKHERERFRMKAKDYLQSSVNFMVLRVDIWLHQCEKYFYAIVKIENGFSFHQLGIER
ncbi:CLUMA_CG016690, isoform A [Clunio marinus]|uniref:CLUMA_CG016690, isoform A n=1 Tax=Clunio marinus TaxID=568069 RepID=A0A1J1IUD2_9DIPT|nr:CLUMA_CG016690, isoform A [Clunio marinus]